MSEQTNTMTLQHFLHHHHYIQSLSSSPIIQPSNHATQYPTMKIEDIRAAARFLIHIIHIISISALISKYHQHRRPTYFSLPTI